MIWSINCTICVPGKTCHIWLLTLTESVVSSTLSAAVLIFFPAVFFNVTLSGGGVALAGTTVSQLLQGGPLPVSVATNNDERSSPAPNVGIDALIDAGIAQDTNRAQVDANGNFTGASGNNPFTVVAP